MNSTSSVAAAILNKHTADLSDDKDALIAELQEKIEHLEVSKITSELAFNNFVERVSTFLGNGTPNTLRKCFEDCEEAWIRYSDEGCDLIREKIHEELDEKLVRSFRNMEDSLLGHLKNREIVWNDRIRELSTIVYSLEERLKK